MNIHPGSLVAVILLQYSASCRFKVISFGDRLSFPKIKSTDRYRAKSMIFGFFRFPCVGSTRYERFFVDIC